MKPEMKTKALEMIGKRYDMDIAQKSVSINKEKHTAIFVMSTSSVDRHGDIVDQNSWMLEHFQKNPAFFWGHRSNDFPLGKWLRVWLEPDPENPAENMLMGEAEFAVDVDPEIQRAWDHVVRGDLNMVSVGFIPHVVEYDENKDCFILKSCELMECSLVGIGSNRRALVKGGDVVDTLIETKAQMEAAIVATDPAVSRKMNAVALINKAIRQYKG
jgi:HK97 family phage prohead protease